MNNKEKFCGLVVPMVTPFTEAGQLDEPAVGRIIDYLLRGNANGIFVLGTTGEAHSMPQQDRRRLVEVAVDQIAGRAVTYAGVSSNCLAESIGTAEDFFELGVDAVVAHLPFYYPMDAATIDDYFTRLAEGMPGPLVVYNMPGTVGVSIPLEVIEKLSHHQRVAAFKDSESNLQRWDSIIQMLSGRDDVSLLVGVGNLSAKAYSLGVDGIVPRGSNIVPGLFQELTDCARAGNFQRTEQLQAKVTEAMDAYGDDVPVGEALAGIKASMSALGLCGPTVLPPIKTLEADEIQQRADKINRLMQSLETLAGKA